MKFFVFGFCRLHRPSNPYKLYNISVQILSILQICAKILLIHIKETRTVHFFINHYICTGVEIKMQYYVSDLSYNLSTLLLMLSVIFLLLSVKNILGYR